MRILSLETATYFGGVACVTPKREASEGPFSPQTGSRQMLPAIDRLLKQLSLTPADLDLVAVSTGPGLFTGVRIGLSIAKTLTWAQGEDNPTALIPVPTLMAVATLALGKNETHEGDLIAAITDARRGEVYAALFRATPNATIPLKPIANDIVVRPELLHERLEIPKGAKLHLIGDGIERYPEIITETFGPQARTISLQNQNLPLAIAQLGKALFKTNGASKRDKVQPHYVRRPDARRPVLQSYLAPSNNEPKA